MNYQSGVTLQNHLFWCCSPAEHIRRQHPLGLQGTSGAGHAKPDYQSGGFPGPFVCCQVRTACCVQGTVRQWWQQIAFILNIFWIERTKKEHTRWENKVLSIWYTVCKNIMIQSYLSLVHARTQWCEGQDISAAQQYWILIFYTRFTFNKYCTLCNK